MSILNAADIAYMQDTIADMLPDVCNILSEALASDGQGGQTSTWGTASTSIACRLDEQTGTRNNQLVPAAGAGLREAHRFILSLPYDTVIGANDRVEIGSYTYHVVSVNDRISWEAVTRAVLELI